jgi:NADH:ubiquinone oxidoreductase subunit 6 (subunit J)
MNAIAIMTYALAIMAAISAVAILFLKEVFHAALSLVVCLLCVAGIFVTFNSEFLAVVQLIVYAGGVLLLIIFGIMLTIRDGLQQPSNNKFISTIIGLSLFSLMMYSLEGVATGSTNPDLSPETIGTLLMTRFAIPFEAAGVLLLVSLIGAILAATAKNQS